MTAAEPLPAPRRRGPWTFARLALLLIPINAGVWGLAVSARRDFQLPLLGLFTLVAAGQLLLGLTALWSGVRARRAVGVGPAVVGGLAALGAVVGWMGGALLGLLAMGGAWGRPLRVRGRQLHPELREGADWTRGERPDATGLDLPTRAALGALWLHDAQKEHASVPAFARISWLLAAVGAPAELLAWSHRAALEEIAHAQLCFALAAGYLGRPRTVEAMPELLAGGLDVTGHPLVVLATESLGDGCQLEDFNADVAAECARVCEEPVTRAVLLRIAREERSHAEFSWALLGWLLERDRPTVAPAIERTLESLVRYPRPTAVSWRKRALVARADPAQLQRHGRLPDQRWGELWQERLGHTAERVRRLVYGSG